MGLTRISNRDLAAWLPQRGFLGHYSMGNVGVPQVRLVRDDEEDEERCPFSGTGSARLPGT